jgi:hypothetical protein
MSELWVERGQKSGRPETGGGQTEDRNRELWCKHGGECLDAINKVKDKGEKKSVISDP